MSGVVIRNFNEHVMATDVKSTKFNGDADYSKAEAVKFRVQLAQGRLHLMWLQTSKLLRRRGKKMRLWVWGVSQWPNSIGFKSNINFLNYLVGYFKIWGSMKTFKRCK